MIPIKDDKISNSRSWEMDINFWIQYETSNEKSENTGTTGEKNALRHFNNLLTKQTLSDVKFQF